MAAVLKTAMQVHGSDDAMLLWAVQILSSLNVTDEGDHQWGAATPAGEADVNIGAQVDALRAVPV